MAAPTDAELKKKLNTIQYQVTRCSATEPPFTGAYWNHKAKGEYACICCSTPLFSSEDKFDSG
ncbi:MAG: peptide-methionine (R)-S-oxide reductase, partial [Betaproteobacteria bacterium]|nr:peptide-methionine (R)-S-oxide reductase [Betaproteobacteria bacterium]